MVVFGSASLAFWLKDAPVSRDVDLWIVPAECGHAVEALMGELSWYHDRHAAYVEVLAPETFAAPAGWRERARRVTLPEFPEVVVTVPHPHDVFVSKIERSSPHDRDHMIRIVREYPLSRDTLAALADETPFRVGQVRDPNRVAAFEINLRTALETLAGDPPSETS